MKPVGHCIRRAALWGRPDEVGWAAVYLASDEAGIVAGVTYNPVSDEMFTAEKGSGAFLNNKRLRVGARPDIREALVAYELPSRGMTDHARSRAEIATLQDKVIGLRSLGSTALGLAYIAAGRLDGFLCRDLKPWDIAGGALIVEEAGGRITNYDGEAFSSRGRQVLASNTRLHTQLVEVIHDFYRDGRV